MTDEQLARNLKSVGQSCFVKYFALFASWADGANVVEVLKSQKLISRNLSLPHKPCRHHPGRHDQDGSAKGDQFKLAALAKRREPRQRKS